MRPNPEGQCVPEVNRLDPAPIMAQLERIPAAIGLAPDMIATAVAVALLALFTPAQRRCLVGVVIEPEGAASRPVDALLSVVQTSAFLLTLDKAAALRFPMVRGPFWHLRVPYSEWERPARRGRSAAFAARSVAVELLDRLRCANPAEVQWFVELEGMPPPIHRFNTSTVVKMLADLADAIEGTTAEGEGSK